MTRLLRLGSRGSALALWQTRHVAGLLQQTRPDLRLETVVISTAGDRLADKPLPEIGGKGLFTEELEAALRAGTIDLAVHSLKDLPTALPSGLSLGAVITRADPSDALVSRAGLALAALPMGARVGTSSTRRKAQLLAHRPDLEIVDLRGNADTRLRKAHDPTGPYDAIVIAHAALVRLGQTAVITELLPDDVMLPAPGQGALAVECRDEEETLPLLAAISHPATEIETGAERAFLASLGGGCAVPVAARGRLLDGGRLWLRGRVCSPDGRQQVSVESETAIVGLGALAAAGGAGGAGAAGAALLRLAAEAGQALAGEALERGAAVLLSGSVLRQRGLEA